MHKLKVEDTNLKNTLIHVNGNLMDLYCPQIMGILNITSDSFYENSRLMDEKELITRAEKQLNEGANLLDIGAFSTRPNGVMIEEEHEIQRIKWALQILSKNFPKTVFSVDTFRGKVAQNAIDNGASIINDISGFSFDPEMINTLKRNLEIGYILMHLEGTFENMHEQRVYQNGITQHVKDYFVEKTNLLAEIGVKNCILDPGFGFSKTIEDNHILLQEITAFKTLPFPLLVGISRKSMIYKKLGISAEDSLNGTIALNAIALSNGASFLRVHDVKEAKQIVDLLF